MAQADAYSEGRFVDLYRSISENPANRFYYQAALAAAIEPIDFDELAVKLQKMSIPKTCTVYPKNALTNLVARGGLVMTIEVDGVPYEGSVEDLRNDESLSDDAIVIYYVQTTEEGKELLSVISPQTKIKTLYEEEPEWAEIYSLVIKACSTDEGASKDDLYHQLEAHPSNPCKVDERGVAACSATYYISKLEDADALVWDGRWHATKEAKELLGSTIAQ